MQLNLIDFLQRAQDVHSILILAGLSDLACRIHFPYDILVVVKDRHKKSLIWRAWRFLLQQDLDLHRVLLAHEARHLLRVELLLHINWAHREALRGDHLVLARRVIAHKLVVHHTGLHVD